MISSKPIVTKVFMVRFRKKQDQKESGKQPGRSRFRDALDAPRVVCHYSRPGVTEGSNMSVPPAPTVKLEPSGKRRLKAR